MLKRIRVRPKIFLTILNLCSVNRTMIKQIANQIWTRILTMKNWTRNLLPHDFTR